jgi:hypothetical protein
MGDIKLESCGEQLESEEVVTIHFYQTICPFMEDRKGN